MALKEEAILDLSKNINMTDVVANNSKKAKKKKKEVVEESAESESSEEELDLIKECHPIGYYMNDRAEMINQMFSVIKGNKLKAMLPPIIKDYDIEKLKLQCLDQLLGMSEHRISCILEGEILETSSESDVSSDSDSSSDEKKRKSEASSTGKPSKIPKVEEPEAAPETGKTLLEILELEMRARAIRALLNQQGTLPKEPVQEPPSDIIDLTEDEVFPTVIKTEPPCEQEQNFEAIIVKKMEKPKMAEETRQKKISKELELRNKIHKKKIYRTRQQRIENEDVPAVAKENVETIVLVKEEPIEIVPEEPEEGEIAEDDEEEIVTVKQEVPEVPIVKEITVPIEGERICGMSEGEFVSNSNLHLESRAEEQDCVINLEDDDNLIELEEPNDVINLIDEETTELEEPNYEISLLEEDEEQPNAVEEEPDSNDALTWKERWLQKDDVRKMVNTSKLVGLVKKRLAQKKLTPVAEPDPLPEPPPVPDPIPVVEGSVDEYTQLKTETGKPQVLEQEQEPESHP